MKPTSTFATAFGLLLTATALASSGTLADTSPRALGDGTVNVIRGIPVTDTTSKHLDNNKLDRRIIGHIPGDRLSEECRGCKNWIDECVDDCNGGDQGSCYEYCRCEGLLGPGCSTNTCRKQCGYDLRDEPDIDENYCPTGGEKRTRLWRRDSEHTKTALLAEPSHVSVST